MNNIKTKEDILAWAKVIVDGKGDKYIPLGKADMFAIAKYVYHGYCNLPEDLEVEDDMPPPTAPEAEPQTRGLSPDKDAAVGTADEKTSTDEVKPPVADTTSSTVDSATTKVTMTRGYALHRAGFTTQQAYDKFLEWSKEHPKEGTVMDFSTGVKSANAAFAYWLIENIVAEVPALATTTRG